MGKPLHGTVHHVAAMLRIGKPMSLVGIDDQLRGNVLVAQGMPELIRLRCWTLSIAVADDDKGGCAGLLYEVDR